MRLFLITLCALQAVVIQVGHVDSTKIIGVAVIRKIPIRDVPEQNGQVVRQQDTGQIAKFLVPQDAFSDKPANGVKLIHGTSGALFSMNGNPYDFAQTPIYIKVGGKSFRFDPKEDQLKSDQGYIQKIQVILEDTKSLIDVKKRIAPLFPSATDPGTRFEPITEYTITNQQIYQELIDIEKDFLWISFAIYTEIYSQYIFYLSELFEKLREVEVGAMTFFQAGLGVGGFKQCIFDRLTVHLTVMLFVISHDYSFDKFIDLFSTRQGFGKDIAGYLGLELTVKPKEPLTDVEKRLISAIVAKFQEKGIPEVTENLVQYLAQCISSGEAWAYRPFTRKIQTIAEMHALHEIVPGHSSGDTPEQWNNCIERLMLQVTSIADFVDLAQSTSSYEWQKNGNGASRLLGLASSINGLNQICRANPIRILVLWHQVCKWNAIGVFKMALNLTWGAENITNDLKLILPVFIVYLAVTLVFAIASAVPFLILELLYLCFIGAWFCTMYPICWLTTFKA